MDSSPRYVLSSRAAGALRALIAPGSSHGSRPRRILSAPIAANGHQWKIEARPNPAQEPPEGEPPQQRTVSVSVGPGIVAWGAGVNFANDGAENLGTVAFGSTARVVWRTTAAPIPLVHDPRWPTGGAPDCECQDCNCPDMEGDPNGSGGDSGELLLVPEDWEAPEGTTDVREIGSVSVSADGGVSISQLQRDTIVARAIVGRGKGGGDKPDETPPCGNPLNGEDDYNPLDHPGGGNYYDSGGTGNPLDGTGDGGYTPNCLGAKDNAA